LVAILLSACAVIALLIAYVFLTAAPIRDTYASAVAPIPTGWSEIPRNAEVERLITRAQRDYLIAPIPRWRAKLVFTHAMVAPPNDLYLIFMPEGEAENAIVYCCAREDGKLLWKALWVRAA
jgi:hypothetical protein